VCLSCVVAFRPTLVRQQEANSQGFGGSVFDHIRALAEFQLKVSRCGGGGGPPQFCSVESTSANHERFEGAVALSN
jgi:hypothetical protein